MTNKRRKPTRHDQLAMIQKEVALMNKRREWLADEFIPFEPDVTIDRELTDDEYFGITAIQAIEEEWILCRKLREELSIIQYEDDDE